jgi:hypothetical protein
MVLPLVSARWTAPGGAPRTGEVPAPAGARADSALTVWVDASGRLTGPPLWRDQMASQDVLAAALAPAVLGLLLLSARKMADRVLDRRRTRLSEICESLNLRGASCRRRPHGGDHGRPVPRWATGAA